MVPYDSLCVVKSLKLVVLKAFQIYHLATYHFQFPTPAGSKKCASGFRPRGENQEIVEKPEGIRGSKPYLKQNQWKLIHVLQDVLRSSL
jgi:hypothetical protein